jgi:Skp family chaperone for outer membrane proteins
MHAKERFLVYGALAGLAALSALQFATRTADANRFATDLGPADSVILTGKDRTLTLRNGDGRLQWGEQATAKAWSIGAVHSDRIMKALLKGDRLAEQRRSLEDEAKAKDEDFRKRYKDLESKYKDVDPKSPGAEDARKEMNAFFKDYNEWRSTIGHRFAKMEADQIEKAYRDLTSAVDLVADRQKVDIVLRFVPTAAKFDLPAPKSSEDEDEADTATNPVPMVMDQIRARTFLHYPEAIDLTDEVMKELGLKDE